MGQARIVDIMRPPDGRLAGKTRQKHAGTSHFTPIHPEFAGLLSRVSKLDTTTVALTGHE
jgi:hypothetical protein